MTLSREDTQDTWGFRLAGGKGTNKPLSIAQVDSDSLAAKVGLLPEDVIVSVSNKNLKDLSVTEGEDIIRSAGNHFQMVIERGNDAPGRKISFEKSAMTVSLKLGGAANHAPLVEKVDEAFISNNPHDDDVVDRGVPKKVKTKPDNMPVDFNKTYNRKDWSCPWVRKDGRGLKVALRAIDDPVAGARTSTQHYYSEPRSILSNDPVLSQEEIQELIRQHGGDSRPNSSMQQNGSRPTSAMQRNGGNPYEAEMEAEIQEEFIRREDRNNIQTREQVAFEDERYTNQLVNTMLEQELNQMRIEEQMNNENSRYSEREVDSQAPPDLEPVTPRNNSMAGDDAYEPSADELIDVLKNLENLAAANPVLYRSIVGQIKESQLYQERAFYEQQQQQQHHQQHNQQQQFIQESNFYAQENEMQMQNGQAYNDEQQQQYVQQMYNEQMNQMNNSEQYHEQVMCQESSEQQFSQVEQFQSQETSVKTEEKVVEIQETDEEKARRLKFERLEREANEQVAETLKKQREVKMAKLHPPEPPKPKEIKVIAGDGKTVTITLGGEKSDDDNNRKQVAEAAGLKHIPLPDFDDSNSAWAGSLKKTDRSRIVNDRQDDNPSWQGSLRHVKPTPKKNRKNDDDDVYGAAPWMGTLRHVVHDNKVTKNYGVNQFQSKRYIDEDACNPFTALGGSSARPAFPLTPAAVINGSGSRLEMAAKEDEEELKKIRGNLGTMKSETVSSAMIKALMPKLLKAHESKYEPIDRDEASKIMEEILAMQVGLNVDQQADANEEAEMMIRAIMQEEVGGAVYSRMADDLEAARKVRKASAKKKKVKKVKEQKTQISA